LKSAPADTFEDLNRRIERSLQDAFHERGEAPAEDSTTQTQWEEMAEGIQVPGSMAAGSILLTFLEKKQQQTVHDPDTLAGAPDLDVTALLAEGSRRQRRSEARIPARTGRYHCSRPVKEGERGYSIAVAPTLRQAAGRAARAEARPAGKLQVRSEDLRKKEFLRPCKNLIVFVVDASESMGTGTEVRIKAAKGAALALLRRAYESRSEVALVAFGGEHATVVLPPTSSTGVAKAALERLPTGGATPFADGLQQAWRLIRAARTKSPGLRPVLVILSDGQANVPIAEGSPVMQELGALAEQIHRDGISAVFIDAAPQDGRDGGMRRIAERMHASYTQLASLTASAILKTFHGSQPAPQGRLRK